MNTYLVGGAVRDTLLGKAIKDRDYVIVGASKQDIDKMLDAGFLRVGADFPVLLHPDTREEYAPARGPGGRSAFGDSSVTLVDDLSRRDLTINAMAIDQLSNELLDPFGGKGDLEAGLLRHVGPSFKDDPIRILRLARFAAELDFTIASETQALAKSMIQEGALADIVPERVWQETMKALCSPSPSRYFLTLRSLGALEVVYPEIEALFGVPQPPEHHPEVDTGVHVMLVLDRASELSRCLLVRFGALCHDLGKGVTPREILPHHSGHEKRGVDEVLRLCKRLKAPGHFTSFAKMVSLYHTTTHGVLGASDKTLLKLINGTMAIKRPDLFEKFLLICEADSQGRTGFERREYRQVDILRAAAHEARQAMARDILRPGLEGQQIAVALNHARQKAISRGRHLHTRSALRDRFFSGDV